jgi:hypothetical protein
LLLLTWFAAPSLGARCCDRMPLLGFVTPELALPSTADPGEAFPSFLTAAV